MADEVIDIVTQLNYEVNADPLKEVEAAFGNQFKAIQELQAQNAKLQQQIDVLGQKEIAQKKQLNAELTTNKRKIDDVTNSIAKQVDGSEKLTRSVKQLAVNTNGVGIAFANIVRDAPFGIIAIGNNITQAFDAASLSFKQMISQGLSAGQAFARIGASLLSLNTLLSVGITALTVFALNTRNAGKETEDAKDKVDALTKSLDDYIKTVKEANKINQLTGTFQAGKSEEQLNRELELLKARGASADLIAAKEREISQSNQTQLELVRQQLQQAQARIRARAEGEDVSGLARLPEPIQALVDTNDSDAIKKRLKEVNNDIANEENTRESIRLTRQRERAEERKKLLEKELKDREEYIKKIKDQYKGLEGIELERLTFEEDPEKLTKIPVNLPDIGGDMRDDEKLKRRQREMIIEYYEFAANTAANALQSMYELQVQYLDKEIELRQERVDMATKLAERGNAEMLEYEVERLQKAQAERERTAQKQIQVNALLQASQMALVAVEALKTVTNAGSNGDPYTAAVRIAAAVAALSAGFAIVTGLTTAFRNKGFAEGGYTGDGGKHDPAGVVHKGEYVMTKERTAQYRPILEAMHKGQFPMMQRLVNPIVGGGAVSKFELKGLEKRMDMLIEATHDGKLKQNIFFNEHGVGLMTEKASRKDKRRFK